jgi:thioredoxin reductase
MPGDRFDAIVVGGGPAGLAAATWLARHRRSVAVLDSREYRNRWVELAHGYLGLDPVKPRELLERGREELAAYPNAHLIETCARSAAPDGELFRVETDEGVVSGRRLVLATGVEDEFPDVPGFFDHYGADVFHCPACDGYEARDKPVAVIGWDEHVGGFALELLEWASRVTVVTEGRRFEADGDLRARLADEGVAFLEEPVRGFVGSRGGLRGLRIGESKVELECRLAFFSIAHHPRSELARSLGCALTDEGCVGVDEDGETSVAGVYACGDVTPGEQLIQVAAAKGAIVGNACARSLSS